MTLVGYSKDQCDKGAHVMWCSRWDKDNFLMQGKREYNAIFKEENNALTKYPFVQNTTDSSCANSIAGTSQSIQSVTNQSSTSLQTTTIPGDIDQSSCTPSDNNEVLS